ncbi:MAG: haloacid dehalogenase [Chloroflexota bacterium]
MQHIDRIAERIRLSFDVRTVARDRALAQTRTLIRHCANAIRAIHRDEDELAQENLAAAHDLVQALQTELAEYPDLYFAGYTQDALKEYAEANIVYGLIARDGTLPTPEDLGLQPSTYLQGLAEAVGELRRRCLDLLRLDNAQHAEVLLGYMDDIFAVLTSMDYPDAITGGLRRLTDIARSIIERTRGDLTISLRQEQLERSLRRVEERI